MRKGQHIVYERTCSRNALQRPSGWTDFDRNTNILQAGPERTLLKKDDVGLGDTAGNIEQ